MDFTGELRKNGIRHDNLFLRHLSDFKLLERYGETKGKHTVVGTQSYCGHNEYFDGGEEGFREIRHYIHTATLKILKKLPFRRILLLPLWVFLTI
jgi:hypothetical protein